MSVRDLTNVNPDLLRELASWGRENGRVLTLVMDLDPSRFATAEARGSEISSLVDQAHRAVEAAGVARDELLALRERVDEARDYLESGDYASEARGLALFGRSSGDDLQPVRLTRTGARRVALDRWPLLAPLAREAASPRWSALLVDRRHARLLRGDPERLEEIASLTDDERETEVRGHLSEEVKGHLDRTAEALRVAHEQWPLDALLIGGQHELLSDMEERLPGELRPLLAGRFEVDMQAPPDAVLEAARPAMDEHAERAIEETLDRLRTGSAHGTGALGLEDVLEALVEARVEILLLENYLASADVECPACGWLGPPGHESCPVDATATERHEDMIEPALGRAVEQDARVLLLHERDDLRPFEGIAAVLRF
ncbi:MAG: hypothetical protein ACR2LH_07435 [Thermoleophilaceae bacterium]